MAFTLQALIGDSAEVKRAAPVGSLIVALPQAKALCPLTKSVRSEHGISFLPLTEEGLDDVPTAIEALVRQSKKIAYVEAEYFGGDGTQASAIWEEGRLVFGPLVASDAINQALRLLGVLKEKESDEFEALSLGRHRDTEKWT